MRQAHDQLYIGDIADARNKSLKGFDVVVTVCQESVEDNISSYTEYHWFNMSDGPHCGYGGDHSYETFEKAADAVLSALRDDRMVFIHCHAGVSRSVSVAAAALAVYEGTSWDSAFARCRAGFGPQNRPDPLLVEHATRYIGQL